ncbi:MAG: hypothetical protein Q7T01_02380 [bacterium]|nr:hypothetical protein [bacterium]
MWEWALNGILGGVTGTVIWIVLREFRQRRRLRDAEANTPDPPPQLGGMTGIALAQNRKDLLIRRKR